MLRRSEALTYPEPLGPPLPVEGDLYLFHWDITLCGPINSYFQTLEMFEPEPGASRYASRNERDTF